jgi:hypothetical protein
MGSIGEEGRMKFSKSIFCRIIFIALLIIIGTATFSQHTTGQKGLEPGGLVAQKTTDPCAELLRTSGNCDYYGGGSILCISDEPEFTSLIKASLEDRRFFPEENGRPTEVQTARVETLRKYMPTLLKGLQSENGCIQRSAIYHIRITKDPIAIEPLFGFLVEHSWRHPVGCYALSALAHVYKDQRVVPYLVEVISQREWSPCREGILDACNTFPYDHRILQALIDRYETQGGQDSLLQDVVTVAEKGADKKEMTAFFKRNAAKYDFGSRVCTLARMVASPETFDDIAAIYKKYYFDRKKARETKELYNILEGIGGKQFQKFLKQPLRQPGS